MLVRLQPPDLAALDAWRAAQETEPSRPEAVRSLMRAGLTIPTKPRPPTKTPPFAEGDVVQHARFGLGRVTGPIRESMGPDPDSPNGQAHTGWTVGVTWDDPARKAGRVIDHALRKVGEE